MANLELKIGSKVLMYASTLRFFRRFLIQPWRTAERSTCFNVETEITLKVNSLCATNRQAKTFFLDL